MRASGSNFRRRTLGSLGAVLIALVIPAAAPAGVVTVTATPASLPAPGGPFQFTISISQYSPMETGGATYVDSRVNKLTDTDGRDISNVGTCRVPASLPYSCSFTDWLWGAPGAVLSHVVIADESYVQTAGPLRPPCCGYVQVGIAAVTLSAPVPENTPTVAPRKKCKKGFALKKVKTKHGQRNKCVRKRH
jgi:hypothetical protein